MLERELPTNGLVKQVVTMLNGQAQRASLPVRTARLLQRSRAQTPSEAGDNPLAPAELLQDVVEIKTLLLQLERELKKPGEPHHSMSCETLDPLVEACTESPARLNGRRPPAAPRDLCAEMRRQILYLQTQLEERDRLVRVLQQQLRMSETQEPRGDCVCNVATQTDRLRAPTLTSSENSGIVSWNEQDSGRKLPSYACEAQKTKSKRPTTNSVTVKCITKVNGHEEDGHNKRTDAVQLKANSRVGSIYLQALANSDRQYKREEEKTRRSIYSTRSRSIENMQSHHYINEPAIPEATVIEEVPLLKHHTSYGDLYNGRVCSKESVNRHSPSLNGHSTDTDYSSDGGYKSLPSSLNCHNSPRKVSGIPRMSKERKFISMKHVKTSAV